MQVHREGLLLGSGVINYYIFITRKICDRIIYLFKKPMQFCNYLLYSMHTSVHTHTCMFKVALKSFFFFFGYIIKYFLTSFNASI